MARKKSEQAGQGLSIVLLAAVVVALVAAALLPCYLAGRYVYFSYKSYRLRKTHAPTGTGLWLTASEVAEFQQEHQDQSERLERGRMRHQELGELITREHERATAESLSRNVDGSYDRRNGLAREIQGTLDKLERERSQLDLKAYRIDCRQPVEIWDELNDFLKKQCVALFGLMGWFLGASFYLAAYAQGMPFGLWTDLFVMAAGAGAGAGLAALFCRNPARWYFPKPAVVTIDNAARPEVELSQQKLPLGRLPWVALWLALIGISIISGRNYGQVRSLANWRSKLTGGSGAGPASAHEVGTSDLSNPAFQRSDGTTGSPVDVSREVAAEAATPNVLKAEPVEADSAELPVQRALQVEGASVSLQGRLDPKEVATWDLARVRYEINTIYARHGVVFADRDIQAHFERQKWYTPIAGLTLKDAEFRFSTKEAADIELLAGRRRAIASGDDNRR